MDQPDKTPQTFQAPPLRIIHLLAWLTLSAVFFSLTNPGPGHQAIGQDQGRQFVETIGHDPAAALRLCLYITWMATLSGDLLGMVLLWRSGIFEQSEDVQPGHCLVVLGGIVAMTCLGWLLVISVPAGFRSWSSSLEPTLWALGTIASVAMLFGTILAWIVTLSILFWAWKSVRRWCWRVFWLILFFGWIVVVLAIPLVSSLPSLFILVALAIVGWPASVAGTLLVAVLLDYRQWAERDWLHWFGVGSTGVLFVLALTSIGVAMMRADAPMHP